jgi:signal-transduction protein with cAMP-binding, CBS, and nucleotidyltransferase domain
MDLTYELLARFTPFNTLTFEYLDKIFEKASLKKFSKGSLIFKRGRELEHVNYLVEGQVDLVDSHFVSTSITSDDDQHRVALNSAQPTQVSAVAKTDVIILMVERDFLDLIVAWSESGHETTGDAEVKLSEQPDDGSDWMSSLLQSPFFNKIPPGNIQQLFVRFKPQTLMANEFVLREGERGDYFYVLQSGSATVLDKQGQLLAALRPGDYFGEEALVGDTTRNASVKMLTNGVLMRLIKEDFVKLLQEPVRKLISYDELQKNIAKHRYQIIDVRLPLERRFQSVPNSRNIPLSQLRKVLPELDQAQYYVVTDDAGRRSDVAAQLLNQAGFEAMILDKASLHQVTH